MQYIKPIIIIGKWVCLNNEGVYIIDGVLGAIVAAG